MNWRIKFVIMPALPLFAAASLAADPPDAGAYIAASDTVSAISCAADSVPASDGCEMAPPYSFDLSEWINQSVIPDHLNVEFNTDSSHPNGPISGSSRDVRNAQMLGLQFQDNDDWVQRLKDIDDLSVMTFWQTEATHLFLGVSDDGLPGVHFKQREVQDRRTDMQRELYRGTNEDGRPLVHSQSLNYNVPDLSQATLESGSDESAKEE